MGLSGAEAVCDHLYQPYRGRQRLWKLSAAGQGAACWQLFLWVKCAVLCLKFRSKCLPCVWRNTYPITAQWNASAPEQEMELGDNRLPVSCYGSVTWLVILTCLLRLVIKWTVVSGLQPFAILDLKSFMMNTIYYDYSDLWEQIVIHVFVWYFFFFRSAAKIYSKISSQIFLPDRKIKQFTLNHHNFLPTLQGIGSWGNL